MGGGQAGVELIEHDARLDLDFSVYDGADLGEVPAHVHYDRAAYSLPTLGRAPPTRKHGHAGRPGDLENRLDIFRGLREDHAQRLDLIVRRVGRVQAPCEGVEAHLAVHCIPKLAREPLIAGSDIGFCHSHGVGDWGPRKLGPPVGGKLR